MQDILPAFILLFGLPVLLVGLFKSNAGALFLAACAGIVLLSSLDPVVITTASSVLPSEGEAYVRTVVVLLSIVFAGLIFKNTVSGAKFFINILLALITGLMLWLLVPGVTGLSWLVSSTQQSLWVQIVEYQALVVALGISLSLVVVLKAKSHPHKKH